MSRRLAATTDSLAAATVAAAQSSLAFPPPAASGAVIMVPSAWTQDGANPGAAGVVPEFDLDIWSTGSLTLTVAELMAGRLRALTVAATAATGVTHGSDLFTKVAHGLLTGDGPIQFTTTTALPAGAALLTDYWVVKLDADTFSIATSLANALAGSVVNLTDNGTGTHTYTGTSACSRVYFHSHGTLPASISLTNQRAFTRRCRHRPEVVCYALVGTLSAGTLKYSITPVQER